MFATEAGSTCARVIAIISARTTARCRRVMERAVVTMAKKMRAHEIIQALICCCDDSDGVAKCAICPFNIDDYQDYCVDELLEQSLTLINRQQAEIAALKHEVPDRKYGCCVSVRNGLIYTHTIDDYDWLIGDISADAIKEFAERLKAELHNVPRVEVGGYVYYLIGEGAIDNIAKEMVGNSDAYGNLNERGRL